MARCKESGNKTPKDRLNIQVPGLAVPGGTWFTRLVQSGDKNSAYSLFRYIKSVQIIITGLIGNFFCKKKLVVQKSKIDIRITHGMRPKLKTFLASCALAPGFDQRDFTARRLGELLSGNRE